MTIQAVNSVSNYIQLTPVVQAMTVYNNKTPDNALPIDTNGTVQSNNDNALPEVTLYNAHGLLKNTKPNSLLGTA